MTAFSRGDEAAFEQLFERHSAAVHALLTRLTRSSTAAADLTQETFVSVVRGRGRFVDGSRFRPWLYTIAVNAFRDHDRRSRREVPLPEGDWAEGEVEPTRSDPGLDRQVREALASLPAAQREAIELHHFQELGYREVGDQVGLSETAVKVRAHRGHVRLRHRLRALWREYVD
jgi:RNA polymerase sigma-70 factor (ECF subfamily)